jgi:hypothetical protein
MERNLKETLQKLWTCTKWNLKKNARNHQEIQRKPWRNPWWTGQRRIVKLGDRIAKCGEWILKLGLWHLEVVFWNLQVVLWNLHCETGKSYCETLPGGLWNSNTRLWNSEEGFWTQKSDHETPCWDSESPCRRSSYHVENNRTYQSDLQVPQAEVDTCMPCQSWKSKNPIVHTQGQFQFWWGWEFWYLLSYHCTHSISNSNAMSWEFV